MNSVENCKLNKVKRLRLMGWIFMALAFACSAFGFMFFNRYHDQEVYYMISGMFVLMGIYCLKPTVPC